MSTNRRIALLVAFGTYLLSEERRQNFKDISEENLDERLSGVNDTDIQKFFESQSKNQELLSYGQKAVGLNFNPSGDDAVAESKQGFADLIDQMNVLRNESPYGEQKRLASVAITECQSAQMWSVKALTYKE